MKNCKYCGAVIENENDTTCQYCGNPIENEIPPQPQTNFGNMQYGQNQYGNNQYGQNPYGAPRYGQPNPYGTGGYMGYNGDSVAVTKANNARILGIVSIFINPFLILSIMAIVFANSATTLSPNNPEVTSAAKTARICAIVSIVLGILGVAGSIAFSIFAMSMM